MTDSGQDAPAVAPQWVELRVHGVSGTPPESMLASAHVCQVAGDDRSRSFRRTNAQFEEVEGPDGQIVEAFHWGRWTSGSWSQALWILLLPFGVVNAAQFMLPTPADNWFSRGAHRVVGGLLRLLALILTLLFTVCASIVVIDLLAWQWATRRGLFFADWVFVVAGLAVTALVVYGLARLGELRTGRRFQGSGLEADRLPDLRDAAFFDGDPDSPALRHLHQAAALFLLTWLGFSIAALFTPEVTDVMRAVPLWALFLTVAVVVFLGDPERTTSVSTGGSGRIRRWWHGVPEKGKPAPALPPSQFSARFLHWLAACGVVLAGGLVAITAPPSTGGMSDVRPELPGIDDAAAIVGIGGTVVTGFLLIATALLAFSTRAIAARAPEKFRRFAKGMTAALAAAVGFFVGIGLTSGIALTVEQALNGWRDETPAKVEDALLAAVENLRDSLPQPLSDVLGSPEVQTQLRSAIPSGERAISAPGVLQRVSWAWGITLLCVAALGIAAWFWLRARRRKFVRAARQGMTFGPAGGQRLQHLPEDLLPSVGAAMQKARLKNHLPLIFWVFAGLGTLLSLAAALDFAHDRWWRDEDGWWFVVATFLSGESRAGEVRSADVLIAVGQYALLGLAGAAVLLARGAIKAEGARRGLNVVWDVIAFWPRSVHPFVPPPYAQQVVPALVRRICWHLGIANPVPEPVAPVDPREPSAPPAPEPENPHKVDTVVVAAHSQGSLISLAALLRLPEEAQKRVKWVTFGSQLRQQFPRAFPHYVNVPLLRRMLRDHNWISLYRDTDPIAGPVTSWNHACDENGVHTSVKLSPLGPPFPLAVPDALGSATPDWIDPLTGRLVCGNEWRLLDPSPSDWLFQTGPVTGLSGHSNYWLDQAWSLALDVARGIHPDGRISLRDT